jgi:hypothetical protein
MRRLRLAEYGADRYLYDLPGLRLDKRRMLVMDNIETHKAPPEAMMWSGFAMVFARRYQTDPLSWNSVFRFACGCMMQTNPRSDAIVVGEVLRSMPSVSPAEFYTCVVQPLDPT